MSSRSTNRARTFSLAWAAYAPWMEADAWGACHSVLDSLRECVVEGVHLHKIRLLKPDLF